MKEYEIVFTYLNGCAGSAYPQTSFEEAELASTDDYIRAKHSKDYDRFVKEVLDQQEQNGQVSQRNENIPNVNGNDFQRLHFHHLLTDPEQPSARPQEC